MENEAPKYASWMPESGGYVADGNVVSKSPMYDTAGKLRLDVNLNEFGNTQPVSSTKVGVGATVPQIANDASTNVGVTTANTQGSSEDVNAPITGAGSMGSLSENTATTGSAINTPATYSPVAGETTVTTLDKINKEYQDAVARGDYQGQINALVEKQRLTGQDYSMMIDQLTRARVDKVANQDALYQEAINNALDNGDTQLARQLMQQQNEYRNTVGYDDAMAQKRQYDIEAQKTQYEKDMEAIDEAYNQKMQEFQINYDEAYLNAIKDIGNSLVQMYPGIINFQYDPMQDMNLQRAQDEVMLRMRNQAAATGMYYSSTTQYAITRAIGELVPVYQKMAREEAIENFKLLQSTASFLMDLEESQFNLWKGQIQMQWAANDEKRKAISSAIEASNARGYINNEEAAILGVAPGTESYEARKEAQARQAEIEAERRKLQQNMIMADFNNSLAIEKAIEQAKIDDWKNEQQANRNLERDWYQQQYDLEKIDANFQNTLARDTQQYRYDMSKLAQEYNYKDQINANEAARKAKRKTSDYKNTPQTILDNVYSDSAVSSYNQYLANENPTEADKLRLLGSLKIDTPKQKGTQEFLTAYGKGQSSNEEIDALAKSLGLTDQEKEAAIQEANNIIMQTRDQNTIIKDMRDNELINTTIRENVKGFSKDQKTNNEIVTDTLDAIDDFTDLLKSSNIDYEECLPKAYGSLIQSIYENNDFKDKTKVISSIVVGLKNSDDETLNGPVYDSILSFLNDNKIPWEEEEVTISSADIKNSATQTAKEAGLGVGLSTLSPALGGGFTFGNAAKKAYNTIGNIVKGG